MVQLEEDVESGYSIVQNRGKELERLNLNNSELKKEFKHKDGIITSLQKMKDISDMVIRTLQDEKADLSQKAKANVDGETKVLMEEIDAIQIENKQKEKEIRDLERINQDAKEIWKLLKE